MAMSRKNFLKMIGLGFLSAGTGKGLAQAASSLEKARAEAAKLKVTGVDIYAYDIPLKEPFKISIGTVYAANEVLIMIQTDAGIAGLGEACPFAPITGGSWDHDKWPGGNLPTAGLIDQYVPDRPVCVSRYDGHMSVANSLALKMAGVTAETPDPPGGEIVRKPGTKEPAGVLRDNAGDWSPRSSLCRAMVKSGWRSKPPCKRPVKRASRRSSRST